MRHINKKFQCRKKDFENVYIPPIMATMKQQKEEKDRKKGVPAAKGQDPVELGPGMLIVLNAR